MPVPGRRAVVALYQAAVPPDLGWPQGPLPLAAGALRADSAARSAYYLPRTARLLYGEPANACRWHKEVKAQAGTAAVVALEAVRVDDRCGLLLVHMIPQDILATVRGLAGRTNAGLGGFDVGRLAPELSIVPRPYTLAFLTGARRLPRLYSFWRYPRWPVTDQWLWALASRTSERDYPPDSAETGNYRQDRTRLSADWSSMVLRDGMALVGTRTDRGGSDPFFGTASLYSRTIYADAIALSLLQLQGITALEEELADIPDALGEDSALDDLERRLAFFRQKLWWQHLTAHGVPNQILTAFHRQHRLPDRFQEILAEVSDYSRLSHDDQAREVNNSAVLFTVITVPVGIGLAALQLLGHPSSAEVIMVIATCLAASLLILLTRPGRLAIRSVRRKLFFARTGALWPREARVNVDEVVIISRKSKVESLARERMTAVAVAGISACGAILAAFLASVAFSGSQDNSSARRGDYQGSSDSAFRFTGNDVIVVAIIVGVIVFAACVAVIFYWRSKIADAQVRLEEGRRQRDEVEKILERLRDRMSLPGLHELNRVMLGEYHEIATNQAQKSFKSAQRAMLGGAAWLMICFTAVILVTSSNGKILAAVLAPAGGALAGFLSRTYLFVYERSLVQLNQYYSQPLLNSYYLTAERLSTEMSEDGRDKLIEKVIDQLLGDAGRLSGGVSPDSAPLRKRSAKRIRGRLDENGSD